MYDVWQVTPGPARVWEQESVGAYQDGRGGRGGPCRPRVWGKVHWGGQARWLLCYASAGIRYDGAGCVPVDRGSLTTGPPERGRKGTAAAYIIGQTFRFSP